MRAIAVTDDKRLAFTDIGEPRPLSNEAIVAVRAISLNRGEVRQTRTNRPAGYRPGWDFAGEVIQEAEDGKGPKRGTRIVGLRIAGAWAERVTVPVHSLAKLPDNVTYAQAASLPVAGLTALGCLEKRGSLLGRRVLITGATGGVGHFATQLARLSGAHVVAAIRSETGAAYAKRHGAHETINVAANPADAASRGPYDLILESVGGASAGAAMAMLAPGGICVFIGISDAAIASFNVQSFYFSGGARAYGYAVHGELDRGDSAAHGLARLLPLVATGQLSVDIALERNWTDINEVADELMNRSYSGKAVLHL